VAADGRDRPSLRPSAHPSPPASACCGRSGSRERLRGGRYLGAACGLLHMSDGQPDGPDGYLVGEV